MSKEKFIEGKRDNAHHSGRHSTMQRFQGVMDRLSEWRRERTFAHEAGHFSTPIGEYLPEGEGQEIVLFEPEPLKNSDQFSRLGGNKGAGTPPLNRELGLIVERDRLRRLRGEE